MARGLPGRRREDRSNRAGLPHAMLPRSGTAVTDQVAHHSGRREVHSGVSIGRYQRGTMEPQFGQRRMSAQCHFHRKKTFGRVF